MTHTSFLSTYKPSFQYYTKRLNHTAINNLEWKPLTEAGAHPFPYSLYLISIDTSSSRSDPPPVPPPAHYYIKPLWDMAQNLLDLNLITRLPDNTPPTVKIFIEPKNETKCRAICDARWVNYNNSAHRPKRYTLPNFDTLKPLLRTRNLIYFHRTDIINCFWSFLLPRELRSLFIFQAKSPHGDTHSYALNRPPFGWDFSPIIVDTIMHSITDKHTNKHFSILTFVDDILSLTQKSPHYCNHKTNEMRTDIQHEKLLIHPPGSAKSTATATTTTDFVGKVLTSGASPSITNTSSTTNSAFFLSLIASTMPLSTKQIQSICGSLQWAAIHNRLARPFFYNLHRLANLKTTSNITLKPATRHGLIQAALLSHLPWTPAEIISTFSHHDLPLFFCDASLADNAVACAFIRNNTPHYLRWPIPPRYANSQQTAELYGLVRTFLIASKMSESFYIISDSTSAIHSALSFNAGTHQPLRSLLLRRLAISASALTHPCYLLWIASEHNPADLPSRQLPYTTTPSTFSSSLPISLFHALPIDSIPTPPPPPCADVATESEHLELRCHSPYPLRTCKRTTQHRQAPFTNNNSVLSSSQKLNFRQTKNIR